MKNADDWKTKAKQLIRAEMKRRTLSYADLASRMQELGLTANERTLANKIAAGAFFSRVFPPVHGGDRCQHNSFGDSS